MCIILQVNKDLRNFEIWFFHYHFMISYLATLAPPPSISFSSMSFCKSVSSFASSSSSCFIFGDDATLYSSTDAILVSGWFTMDGLNIWMEFWWVEIKTDVLHDDPQHVIVF